MMNSRMPVYNSRKSGGKTPVKVIYDTSVLGIAQYVETARTGVFRVAEALACGLAESVDVELYFSAAESVKMQIYAQKYLENHPKLRHVNFLSYGVQARAYDLVNYAFEPFNHARDLGYPLRAVRRTLFETLKLIERRNYPLTEKDLVGKDLFHSPYWALPAVTKRSKRLQRFLTVHDLISILQPEVGNGGGDFLKSILKSLDPSDWVICVSQATKKDLCNFDSRLDPEKVFVVPWAASDIFYPCKDPKTLEQARRRAGISERPYILSVCTLEPRKNMVRLIRSFAHLVEQEKIKELDLVLVGAKAQALQAIKETIAQFKKLRERIVITGYLGDEHLAPIYSGALMFAYPSLREGFGLPVIEAMQCGVPVVTSNVSSLPEVAGNAALLVNPTDEQAIAEAMGRLYRDSDLRTKLAAASLEQAKKFSWTQTTDQVINAYKTALR